MVAKAVLTAWVEEALRDRGGSASLLEVAKHIWDEHEGDLRAAGDLFYTWQYDMRWAATSLRHSGRMRPAAISPPGTWELA